MWIKTADGDTINGRKVSRFYLGDHIGRRYLFADKTMLTYAGTDNAELGDLFIDLNAALKDRKPFFDIQEWSELYEVNESRHKVIRELRARVKELEQAAKPETNNQDVKN
jgi:hypothetical protein